MCSGYLNFDKYSLLAIKVNNREYRRVRTAIRTIAPKPGKKKPSGIPSKLPIGTNVKTEAYKEIIRITTIVSRCV